MINSKIDWYDSWCEWYKAGTLCSVFKMTIQRLCSEGISVICRQTHNLDHLKNFTTGYFEPVITVMLNAFRGLFCDFNFFS